MSWQTLESLKERKLLPWLRKKVITKEQYLKICSMCDDKGFFEALGYATRCKYKTHPELKKKYEYKWINVRKKDCQLNDYITKGSFSGKRQKRRRIWRNVFFFTDGSDRYNKIREENPDWQIFFMQHNSYRIGLRRELA
jgi:hypothetical protein